MLHSISGQPLRYNLRKIFIEGYHYIGRDGKRFALNLRDRAAVGLIGRVCNPLKLAERVWLKVLQTTRHRPAVKMRDGYARLNLGRDPVLEQALKVCDDKIATFVRFRAGDRSVVSSSNLAAYESETAKTRDDPLKHAPYRYDQEAADALVRLFLSPSLYTVAAEHLGLLPILGGVRILYSPNEASDGLTNAQLFHVDPEGARQVKVFIAVRDVGPQNSPVTFIPEGLTARMLRSGEPGFLSKRVPDDLVLKSAPVSCWVTHEGRRGDMLFVDTSRCLHFGSRPNAQPRCLLYGQYLDPFSSVFPAIKAGGGIGKAFRFYPAKDRIERLLLGRG